VDPRYATIALRAAGNPAGARVRWYVDDLPVTTERWRLAPGRHRFTAHAGRSAASVEVYVEGLVNP
jgi:hypothetical protein